jgi:holo-[acyl-carrier protein] synthase
LIIRIGIDLVELAEFEAACKTGGEPFLQNSFTTREIQDCGSQTNRLAARFAAKEAAAKALGQPLGIFDLRSIEVISDEIGRPSIMLTGATEEEAMKLGLVAWEISLTHSNDSAMAIVVAYGVGRD